MIRPVVTYPDARLRQRASPVERFGAELRALADDLSDTIRAAFGVGIAGPHIGVSQRVVLIELSDRIGPRVYVNPEIVWRSTQTSRHEEGSISMPGVTDMIDRPAQIRLRYFDLDGGAHEAAEAGFLATCLQHEIDQLDGVFWLERLSRLRRDRVVKRYQKLGKL